MVHYLFVIYRILKIARISLDIFASDWGIVQLVDHLPSNCKVLCSIPSTGVGGSKEKERKKIFYIYVYEG
jgi:hypothetical protein